VCEIRGLYRRQCNDVVIYNFRHFSLPSERVRIWGGERGKHGSGPLTGYSEELLFDPNFFGKDFWCAGYVDCAANNGMMLSFTILDIFLHRVNVFGFKGGERGKHGSGPLTGFSECLFFDPKFFRKKLLVSGIRRLYRKQCNDVVIYNFGNYS
jgi:hypothetical protein